MNEKTLIIHGWSDSSSSFDHVEQFLTEHDQTPVDDVYFGDYDSQEDHLRFYDVAEGLHSRLIQKGFIDPDGTKNVDLNVLVHSTGGPVIRHWIWRYYLRDENRMDACPINRLLMLAPANFGSPLAHYGKSFLGSLVRGKWAIDDLLEVGKNLLTGLELASPYQWKLAHRDLIRPTAPYRPAPEQITTTVLVGADRYEGTLTSYVNKPGTDGTVVVSGTPLNTVKVTVNCCDSHRAEGCAPIEWNVEKTNVDIAFGIVPELNHTTLVEEIGSGRLLDDLVLRALNTGPDVEFLELKDACEELTTTTYNQHDHTVYQQFYVHAIDDQDEPITDYSIEFNVVKSSKIDGDLTRNVRRSAMEKRYSARLHDQMTGEIHTHSEDASYRRFLIDLPAVRQLLTDARDAIGEDIGLAMKVHVPSVDDGIRYDTERLRNIVVHRTDRQPRNRPTFFYPNTTTLVELRLNRQTTLVDINQTSKHH